MQRALLAGEPDRHCGLIAATHCGGRQPLRSTAEAITTNE
jgi:hypothetical protein